jgi:hypothetical protein
MPAAVFGSGLAGKERLVVVVLGIEDDLVPGLRASCHSALILSRRRLG